MLRNRMRQARGASLVELLITTLVMAIASSAVFGLLVTTMQASKKLNNKSDAILQVQSGLDKIGRDVRMGRTLGDLYGTYDTPTASTNMFPSRQNPQYGSLGRGLAPPNGWQTAKMGNIPYTLGPQCLIIQTPIFGNQASGNYNFPLMVAKDAGAANVPPANSDNVETHIYNLAADPDPSHPNEFILWYMRVPGFNNLYNARNANEPAQVGPIALISGIVGPLAPNGAIPQVFSYINRTNSTGDPESTFSDPAQFMQYSGVCVNLELRKHNDSTLDPQSGGTRFKQQGVMMLKSEFYLRNNTVAPTVGS